MRRVRSFAPMTVGLVLATVGVFTLLQPAAGSHGQGMPQWWKPPSDVRAQLAQVSARSLERYDRALVGFGTRHTLSTQDDPQRGIGAARDYIFEQFQQSAATSNGRMTVEKQTFVQPISPRIPSPTPITNV